MVKSMKAIPSQIVLDASSIGLSRTEYIDADIVAASSVLSGIAKAGRKANLLGNVAPREFRMWSAVVQMRSYCPQSLQLPFVPLCTVAKVGCFPWQVAHRSVTETVLQLS